MLLAKKEEIQLSQRSKWLSLQPSMLSLQLSKTRDDDLHFLGAGAIVAAIRYFSSPGQVGGASLP